MNKTIQDLTDRELMVIAHDLQTAINQNSEKLRIVNTEIMRRIEEEKYKDDQPKVEANEGNGQKKGNKTTIKTN